MSRFKRVGTLFYFFQPFSLHFTARRCHIGVAWDLLTNIETKWCIAKCPFLCLLFLFEQINNKSATAFHVDLVELTGLFATFIYDMGCTHARIFCLPKQ